MLQFLKRHGLLVLVVVMGTWLAWSNLRSKLPDLPEAAPPFNLPLVGGGFLALEDVDQGWAVLNFWATWCAPCLEELPELAAFSASHPHVSVVGVAMDSGSAAEVAEAARVRGIPYPVALGDEDVRSRYDIRVLPTTVVLAPGGRVADVRVGLVTRKDLAGLVGGGDGG